MQLPKLAKICRKTREPQKKLVKPTIVALLAEEQDRVVVSDFCHRSGWDVSIASTSAEAFALIDRIKAPILFVDRDLAGADWRETVSAFASSSGRTRIMLIYRAIDAYLWNEVARNGG